jgi:predicted phosphodiesterase
LRKNGDTHGAKTVQQIVAIIFPEAKTKIAKDKKSLVITLGDNVDNDALDRFKNAVKDGLSIRGNLLAAIKGEDKTENAFDLSKFAEQIAKRIAKENVTEASLVAAINTQVKALMVAKASKKAA